MCYNAKCFNQRLKSLYSVAVENIEIFWNDLLKYIWWSVRI